MIIQKIYLHGLLQVHNVSITDFNPKLMQWDESLEFKFLNELKQYQKSSDNVYVMEIVLNNHLDFYHDGIYSHKDDLNIHIGANVIGTTDRVFGVYYQWKVNIDYSIEIVNIQVCKQKNEFLNKLNECGNEHMYFNYSVYFTFHNIKYPKNEIDRLKQQLEDKKVEKLNLDNEIYDLENQINQLEKIDNYSSIHNV